MCEKAFDMERWMAEKREGDVLLEHVGEFTWGYIDSVLPEVERRLAENVERDFVRKRAFHIFVECAQNLYHHVEEDKEVAARYGVGKLGVIVMSKEGDRCRISTGNFVREDREEELQEQIDRINSLSEDGLKELYRTAMCTNEFSQKGGAGLGMIDMARKSGNKLGCRFFDVAGIPGMRFFSFDVVIGK